MLVQASVWSHYIIKTQGDETTYPLGKDVFDDIVLFFKEDERRRLKGDEYFHEYKAIINMEDFYRMIESHGIGTKHLVHIEKIIEVSPIPEYVERKIDTEHHLNFRANLKIFAPRHCRNYLTRGSESSLYALNQTNEDLTMLWGKNKMNGIELIKASFTDEVVKKLWEAYSESVYAKWLVVNKAQIDLFHSDLLEKASRENR
jgi:hypothetical protein